MSHFSRTISIEICSSNIMALVYLPQYACIIYSTKFQLIRPNFDKNLLETSLLLLHRLLRVCLDKLIQNLKEIRPTDLEKLASNVSCGGYNLSLYFALSFSEHS